MIKFDHICCAVKNVQNVFPFIKRHGGLKKKGGSTKLLSGCQFTWPNGSTFELIEPPNNDPNHFVNRFLQKRGPGLHHITFIVPSLKQSIKKAEDLGFKIVGHSDAKPWWKEAFFHPKESLNIVVQIVESDESVKNENAWNINWSKFSEFDKLPEPVEPTFEYLHGLKMKIRPSDRKKAVDLFSKALLGKNEEIKGYDLCYSWKDSPMKIYIQEDQTLEEEDVGPFGILYQPRDDELFPTIYTDPKIKCNFIPQKF